MDQTVVGNEQEIPDWKVKRTENLKKARQKADELRKEIREATGAKPIGKQRLKSKLALLKNEAVVSSETEVVIETDKEPVNVDQPEQSEPEAESEAEPEAEPEPVINLKKSIRPKAKKKPKVIVPVSDSEGSDEEVEKKTLKKTVSVSNFTEAKPKITQGRDGLWYF